MSVHSLQAGLQACKLCTVTRVSQASRRLQGVSSRLSSTHAAPVASRYPYHARSFSSSSSSFRVQRTKPPPTSKVFRGRETRDKPSYDGTFEGLFSKKRARGSYRKGNGAAQAAASAFNLSSEVPEALGSVEPTREEVFAALQRRIEELRDGSATKSSRGPTGPGMASILKAVATSLGISPAALLRLAQEWVASDPLAAATRSLKGKGKQAKENDKGINLDSVLADMRTFGERGLDRAVLSNFTRWVLEGIHRPWPDTLHVAPQVAAVAEAMDLRYPAESYPAARAIRRKLILHVGPTNSGKTYNALCALARARNGAFAGPLRLLATEVYNRFHAGTIGGLTPDTPRVCNLITGEERRIHDPFAGLESCTVEMMNLSKRFDVVVIDEIQMIGDPNRGSAWTAALLGVKADEIHLCGEPSVVDLIKRIGKECGDEVIVKEYQRLSPLRVAKRSLQGKYDKVQRGDCVVTFSRNNIFAVKKIIEQQTGLRVAVAYGGLPPEVREEQAKGFNNADQPGGYDVMVASDAIGMGLNLKIKRIIFETLHKWDGVQEQELSTSQIKQIGGRAGRYGVHKAPLSPSSPDEIDPSEAQSQAPLTPAEEADESSGVVTCLEEEDMDLLRTAMAAVTKPIPRAALNPSPDQLEKFRAHAPQATSQTSLLEILPVLAASNSNYFVPSFSIAIKLSTHLENIVNLTLAERWQIGSAPVNLRDPHALKAFTDFATSHAEDRVMRITNWIAEQGMSDLLQQFRTAEASLEEVELRTSTNRTDKKTKRPSDRLLEQHNPAHFVTTPLARRFATSTNLMQLESLHRCISLYLWLSNRFTIRFPQKEEARLLKGETQEAIDLILQQMTPQSTKGRGTALRLPAIPAYKARSNVSAST